MYHPRKERASRAQLRPAPGPALRADTLPSSGCYILRSQLSWCRPADDIFACPERNSVRLLSKYVTTYAYEFNDENAYLVFALFPPSPPITFPLGSPHFSEVPFLFDVFFTPSNFTPGQQLLSEAMISYWTHFAATGDPNSGAEPLWSPYSLATDEFQSLIPPTPVTELDASFDMNHKCSGFWDTF